MSEAGYIITQITAVVLMLVLLAGLVKGLMGLRWERVQYWQLQHFSLAPWQIVADIDGGDDGPEWWQKIVGLCTKKGFILLGPVTHRRDVLFFLNILLFFLLPLSFMLSVLRLPLSLCCDACAGMWPPPSDDAYLDVKPMQHLRTRPAHLSTSSTTATATTSSSADMVPLQPSDQGLPSASEPPAPAYASAPIRAPTYPPVRVPASAPAPTRVSVLTPAPARVPSTTPAPTYARAPTQASRREPAPVPAVPALAAAAAPEAAHTPVAVSLSIPNTISFPSREVRRRPQSRTHPEQELQVQSSLSSAAVPLPCAAQSSSWSPLGSAPMTSYSSSCLGTVSMPCVPSEERTLDPDPDLDMDPDPDPPSQHTDSDRLPPHHQHPHQRQRPLHRMKPRSPPPGLAPSPAPSPPRSARRKGRFHRFCVPPWARGVRFQRARSECPVCRLYAGK